MEDPTAEWEIADYSSSLEDEDSSEKSSKLGWVLNTGLSLGKKFVITGFVISSVPLILPPLVVISAIGFAVSVPFGFVFASYAGTEKLMSKLLPSPPPSKMIGYDVEAEEGEGMIATENEDKDRVEDVEDGNEIVVHFLGSDDGAKEEEKLVNEDKFTDDKAGEVHEELSTGEAPEVNEEESMQNERSEGLNKMEMKSEGQNAVQDVKFSEPVLQVQTVKVVVNKGNRDVECRKEIQLDSGDKNGTMEKNVPGVARITENERKRQTTSKGKGGPVESDKRAKKKTSTTGQKLPGNKKGNKRHEKASDSEVVTEERKTDGPSEGILSGSDNVESGQILAAMEADKDQRVLTTAEKDIGSLDILLEENEKRAGSKMNDVDIKNVVVLASEIPEVTDEKNVEAAASIGLPESKNLGEIPELKGDNDAFSADHGLHSNKEQSRDVKIWEEIDAIRVIVGFQAPRDASYTEELKALYLFTGIEPLSSSTPDSSDPVEEFYSKLQFLKSVIGVK